jgi:hypothetical protein
MALLDQIMVQQMLKKLDYLVMVITFLLEKQIQQIKQLHMGQIIN